MTTSTDAYKVLQDVSIPRALFKIGEDANENAIYETEGRMYVAGSYVLAEDITPPLRKKAEDGELEHLLEPVSREEATAAINAVDRGTFAPEHSVEHQALVAAGHTVVDRATVLELRSAGAEDAAAAQAEAYADGADARPGLSLTESAPLGQEEAASVRVADAPDEQYADADTALDAGVQVTPSGVVAVNPFVDKAAKTEAAKTAKSGGRRRKPAASENAE